MADDFPADDTIWAITVVQSYITEDVVNTFTVADQGVTPLTANEVALTAGEDFRTNFDNLQVNELSYIRSEARQVVAPLGLGTVNLSGTGALTGEGSPGSIAVCVSLKTGFQGGSHRGRFYLSGVPLSPGTEADPNHLASDFLTNYQTQADAFATALAGHDLQLVVLSRYSGTDPVTGKPIPRATPVWNTVTSILVNSRLDTQRRRLGRL